MSIEPEVVEVLYPISRVEVFTNGLVVHRSPRYLTKPTYNPRKGIYEMSKKSRLKLTHIVTNSSIKFVSMATLTYGNFLPPVNGQELKRQLNIMLKRFRQRFRMIEYLWFLEFTAKGLPHIHLLTTVRPSEADRVWLGGNWSKITTKDAWVRLSDNKVKDYKVTQPLSVEVVLDEWQKSKKVHSHKRAWEEFYKEDGATRYCLKYATKAEQKLVPKQYGNVGRFWGASDNVHPFPIGELLMNETMDREGLDKVFKGTFVENMPLIPKYIFQKDALEYFSKRGLKLTEIFGDYPQKLLNKVEDQ